MAIMADKMKKQQEQSKMRAAKETEERAKQSNNTKKKSASAGTAPRRSTWGRANQEVQNDTDSNAAANGRTTRRTKRGQTSQENAEKSQNIISYFKRADVDVKDDNPTVQEALAHEADELEAHPTAIGQRQDLVATQQPREVTGGEMKEYQLEGLEWLKSLFVNGLSGILADEMGLGKTIQAISLIAFLKENNTSGPFLICAPLSTISNWIDEFARWTPGINTVLYHGSKEDRADLRKKVMRPKDQKNADFPVVCTSYEICMNDSRFLSRYQWKYIIVVSSCASLLLPSMRKPNECSPTG